MTESDHQMTALMRVHSAGGRSELVGTKAVLIVEFSKDLLTRGVSNLDFQLFMVVLHKCV